MLVIGVITNTFGDHIILLKNYSFGIPQTVEFGVGCLSRIPEILKESSSEHVLLISDHGLESIGVVDKVAAIIRDAGVECDTFLDVVPNPTVEVVEAAEAKYRECGATSVVALGGGSPMDVAKAVGVLAKFGGKVTDYEGLGTVPGRIIPMIAIPTTAGTGSEATASAVITDTKRNYKFSIISHEVLPRYAVLDPQLIMTAPASVAAACGVDALIHAMEAYLSTAATPFTDAMAEKAMELIGGNLRRFVANRKDEEAACAMMAGSNFAGIAFAWAKLGNVHAMSHPVSAYFGVAHGVANAVLLPTVVEYNALSDHGRYEKIYNYIREGKDPVRDFIPEMLVKEIRKLNRDLGIPEGLAAVGVTEDKIEDMAKDAAKTVNVKVNPRQTGLKELIMLYKKAMYS